MIIVESRYNPLRTIFVIIKEVKNPRELSNSALVFVQRHLIKGGIITETPSELQTVLELLFKAKQEYYGES